MALLTCPCSNFHLSLSRSTPSNSMTTSLLPLAISGGSGLNGLSIERKGLLFAKAPLLGKPGRLTIERKLNHKFTAIRAAPDDGANSGSGFLAGFLLGGVIVGSLVYAWAPEIRRKIRSENKHGFVQGRRPLYYYEYDQPMVKAEQILHEKTRQLNEAIDNVSLRLRGKKPRRPKNPDEEILGI